MEFWEILDEDGKKTGKIIEKEMFPKECMHLGVDVWIINEKNELLIQKRSANRRHSSNMWAVTGGAVMAGEESSDTVCREVKEELGIEINKKDLLLVKQYKVKDQKISSILIDTYIIRKNINIQDIKLQKEEVSEVKWATWEECQKIYESGQFMEFRWEAVKDLFNCMKYIKKDVKVMVDRPLGSMHYKWKDIKYLTNYGYIPNTISGDGEEIDCYILGEDKPLKEYRGRCIAVLHRLNDNDDKLIIVPQEKNYTNEQIEKLVEYQEKYFKNVIIRY